MIQLRIAQGCRPTGELLKTLLRNKGVGVFEDARSTYNGVVCWGLGYGGQLPALNRGCGGHNKLEQLIATTNAGLKTVPYEVQIPLTGYPLLARQFNHMGGRDIKICLQEEDAVVARQQGYDFFTYYTARKREFRVWVYRRRHLRTYEKVLRYPEKYKFIGCNQRNGFAFELLPSERLPREAVELAQKAVDVLGLDFGAADILQGKDDQFYLLEVNTAPGAEGPRDGISALADKITRWVSMGYPRRNGELRNEEAINS